MTRRLLAALFAVLALATAACEGEAGVGEGEDGGVEVEGGVEAEDGEGGD